MDTVDCGSTCFASPVNEESEKRRLIAEMQEIEDKLKEAEMEDMLSALTENDENLSALQSLAAFINEQNQPQQEGSDVSLRATSSTQPPANKGDEPPTSEDSEKRKIMDALDRNDPDHSALQSVGPIDSEDEGITTS